MKLSRRSIFALIAGALASPAMARVKPFATGGVVPAGPRYLIGGHGPELCMSNAMARRLAKRDLARRTSNKVFVYDFIP